MENLGVRLKQARQKSGLSLREVARQLRVSPSFVSQMENGKSTPSVATLYSLAQLLDVSVDELFTGEPDGNGAPDGNGEPDGVGEPNGSEPVSPPVPADLPSLPSLDGHAWWSGPVGRVSVTRPGRRKRLEMDTGVIWEQLATNTGADADFMRIFYPPHSSSTNDRRMLQHSGSEFGYLLEGELEVTVGFDVIHLRAGDAIGFESSTPHLLTNKSDKPALGIWFVRHPHA
jgi:transcriptional regulator with XRE-family HTH domain